MNSPYPRIHRTLVHPFWTWKDGNYPYRHLPALERSQFWSRSELEALQLERLRAMIRHAHAHCPFYRARWEAAGVGPDSLNTLADLARFPVVDKRDIQEHREEMRRQDVPASSLVANRTGGSTGEPLQLYVDRERIRSRFAAALRHDRWAGREPSTMTAIVWGHPIDVPTADESRWEAFKNRWVFRQAFLDAGTLSEERMRRFVDQLRAANAEVMLGYANALYLFAEFLRTRGVKDLPRPRSIISTAEYLEPDRRKVIEEVFDCPVFDRYGSREVSIMATECDRHDGLHVNAEQILLETVREGRAVPAGETGEILITDLLNVGMPLIRYRIRDAAAPMDGDCACGRGLPRIRMTGGRVTDFLVTPEGRLVSGAALTICLVATTPGIRQAQLVQETRAAVVIRLVKGDDFTDASVRHLLETSRGFVGDTMKVELDYVDVIPTAASGKHLFCLSKVNPFE